MMLIEHMAFWHWWVLAIALVVLEIFISGAVFLSMSIAAGMVGLVIWAYPPLPWTYQWSGFVVITVISLLLWQPPLNRSPLFNDDPRRNRRGEQYIGRTFILDEPLKDGNGTIEIDGVTWNLRGHNCKANSRILITGVDGTTLLARRLHAANQTESQSEPG